MSVAATGPMKYARALRSRPFAFLWAGQAISALGDGTFYVALAWEVLLLTGSGTAMAGVIIAGTIPRILFFLIGGVAADRLPRRLILLWSDTFRAAIVLLIALLGWTHLLQMWHLIGLSLLFGVVDGFFNPAYQAIIPQLVEKDVLPSANALTGISQKVGFILGPLLAAGSIALLTTPASAFAFDGITFIASVICILAFRMPIQAETAVPLIEPRQVLEPGFLEPAQENVDAVAAEAAKEEKDQGNAPAKGIGASIRSVFKDAGDGFRYVMQSRWLSVTIPISALCNIAISGPSQVATPKLVHDSYGGGAWLLSALLMANSIGSIGAMFLVGQVQLKRRGLLAFLANAGLGIVMIVFGLPIPHSWAPIVAPLAALAGGTCLGFFAIIWMTLLQEMVPADKLGRVSSIDMLGSYALLPVGYAAVGLLTDWVGASWVFLAGGALNILLCIIALSFRDVRNLK